MATKNHLKGASFTYAFERINESIKAEFYLEAVTLAESIISDRLLSFVKHHKKSVDVRTKFYNLIQLAAKHNTASVQTKKGVDLFVALDLWRDERNKCIHSISKSEPSTPTVPVGVFVGLAKQCAKDGKVLARLVCDWDKKHR